MGGGLSQFDDKPQVKHEYDKFIALLPGGEKNDKLVVLRDAIIAHGDAKQRRTSIVVSPINETIEFDRFHVQTVENVDEDTIKARHSINKCLKLRRKWMIDIHAVTRRGINLSECSSEMIDGIMTIKSATNPNIFPVNTFQDYVTDYKEILKNVYSGPSVTYCSRRLEILKCKFKLHLLHNQTRENNSTKDIKHRDFNNVIKVDTHIHHTAMITQQQLLLFIKNKLHNFPNEIICKQDNNDITLSQLFEQLNLTEDEIDTDCLGVQASDTFMRFDIFNDKYNLMGQSLVKEIFLKTTNLLEGRYMAELTQIVMKGLEHSKYQMVEWRISIQGKTIFDWNNLANWFYKYQLAHTHVRWLIQTPRIFDILKTDNIISNFGQMLYNIFNPLFEITLHPESNPALVYFLDSIVGFDSVDDESRPERDPVDSSLPTPEHWTDAVNPPYGYWMYYFHTNIKILNQLRTSKGMKTFEFRPHCGEAGSTDHLIAAYLTSHRINHGITLTNAPSLQYLYYLLQIGIAMSPISNNKLFLAYEANPFPSFFAEGLNVSLSTDDPLIFHSTNEPLLEEYSVAAHIWKLSATDLCEIARNSVLQSGWDLETKKRWLGNSLEDPQHTNIGPIRFAYRAETLREEFDLLA
eukprot:gene7224-14733_t